jgi:ribokinase
MGAELTGKIMRTLNIGSLNIDHVYSVEQIVRGNETVPAYKYEVQRGGKGLNQAIALARAGAEVFIAGAIGSDGDELLHALQAVGVNVDHVAQFDTSMSGHALIQVAHDGTNSIVVYGGANKMITREMIDTAIGSFHAGDFLLLQNEISHVAYALAQGKRRGLTVVFNPSPVDSTLLRYPLDMVDIFILNEIEARALTDLPNERDYSIILKNLHEKFPATIIVLTVGENGVMCQSGEVCLTHGAYDVPVVDTTTAGDTFCGYFVACLAKGMDLEEALECASKAGALAVGKKGASESIPLLADVNDFRSDAAVACNEGGCHDSGS